MPIAVLTLAALSFLFASLLVLAHRKLHVDEDPRIDAAHQMLPGTNCGACGFPGCLGLAEAMVDGSALPGKCTVMNEDERDDVAVFLGVDAGAEEKVVARLACAGGTNVARNRARYEGLDSCRAATLVAGGGKACFWGCLGLGDCEKVCDLDAIYLNEHDLPIVIEDACTACGDCVDACPKDLFSLHPVSHHLWVACKNLEKGDAVLADCEVACDACGNDRQPAGCRLHEKPRRTKCDRALPDRGNCLVRKRFRTGGRPCGTEIPPSGFTARLANLGKQISL